MYDTATAMARSECTRLACHQYHPGIALMLLLDRDFDVAFGHRMFTSGACPFFRGINNAVCAALAPKNKGKYTTLHIRSSLDRACRGLEA